MLFAYLHQNAVLVARLLKVELPRRARQWAGSQSECVIVEGENSQFHFSVTNSPLACVVEIQIEKNLVTANLTFERHDLNLSGHESQIRPHVDQVVGEYGLIPNLPPVPETVF